MNAVLRLATWLLALALVALPVVAVLNGWIGADQWPLRRLRVTGEFERVSEAQLRATLVPFARRGFFAVPLDQAQSAVAALPWVAHAEVRKRWPDVLEVKVVEHRPFARWGEDRVLSAEGALIAIAGARLPPQLPRFQGPDARARDVVAVYNESSELFGGLGLAVRRVTLDRRGSWSLVLDGGTRIVLGRSETQVRLARFIRLLPRLLANSDRRLARADLRYTNGFALAWGEKKAAASEAGSRGSAGKTERRPAAARTRIAAAPSHPNILESRTTT